MEIIEQFRQVLRRHASVDTKQWFENYSKGHGEFLGLKTPLVECLVKEFLPNIEQKQYWDFAVALLWQPYTEEYLAGIVILQKHLVRFKQEQILGLAERLFCRGRIQWWNTCDWLCLRILGPLIRQNGQSAGHTIAGWKAADCLWQRRAALVSFVGCAKTPHYSTCLEDILSAASYLVRSAERFHQTAVGWLMREVGKGNEAVLLEFLWRELPFFSAEGLRYATEKLPKDLVRELRQKHKAVSK